MNNRSYLGFTLAETMITLGIVGVVAVLTLPNIMASYKMKSWNSAEAVFQARMEDAVVTMHQTGKLEGITTTEEFVSELKNYMNIRNICTGNNLSQCFSSGAKNDGKTVDLSKITSASDLGHKEYDTNTVAIQTAFGVNAIIAFDKNCDLSGNPKDRGFKCVTAVCDVNGIQGPNTVSKDIRGVNTTIFASNIPPSKSDIPSDDDNSKQVFTSGELTGKDVIDDNMQIDNVSKVEIPSDGDNSKQGFTSGELTGKDVINDNMKIEIEP